MPREDTQTLSFRGRRSRNKVSVGEPAEGSLSFLHPHLFTFCVSLLSVVLGQSPLVRFHGAPRLGGFVGFSPSPLSVLGLPGPVALSTQPKKTSADPYLDMNNDEERSEMRYVMRLAQFSESSKL